MTQLIIAEAVFYGVVLLSGIAAVMNIVIDEIKEHRNEKKEH